ncbi:MAG: dockerin type I repeat-containing protein, partial [Bacillota bacterium]
MPKYKRKGAGAKFPLILLSTLIFILLLASPVSAVTLGDVTDNNTINVQDVLLVMQHNLGIADPELTEDQMEAADVNCDGDVDVQDATLIMQMVLGLIDEFPCDEAHADLSYTAEATGKKVVTISFNKAVAEPDDAEIRLMREPSTTQVSHITTSWNDDRTEVELRRSVNFNPGDYKLTISGLELENAHYDFSIASERVGSISITSPNLVVEPSDARLARGHYRVFNQYGEDITSRPLAANLSWTSSLGDVAEVYDDNEGVVNVDVFQWATPFTLSDELTLTAVNSSSEVTTTSRVGIVDTMEIQSFRFGEITPLPAPRRVVEVGWNPAARILIDRALDENENNRNTYGELQGQISLVSSDSSVDVYLADKDYGYSSDKQAAIFVDTTGISTERTISITVISNKTGETFQMPLTIGEDPYARGVEIGSIEDGKAYGDRSDAIASG